ncbi:MAG: LamG protein, partial [Candidatus Poribacteria bacterium]|nr:LamG protein [Candidatus Poribacteria bacterium]
AYSSGIDWGANGVIIDEVGVFNSALSADEIKEVMTKGLGEATGIAAVSSAGKLATAWGRIKFQ